MSRRNRVPNHPPLLDRAASAVGGKTVVARFTRANEEAQAILDEFDRQVAEADAKASAARSTRGDSDV